MDDPEEHSRLQALHKSIVESQKQTLDISSNGLRELNGTWCQVMTRFPALNISYNFLKSLPDTFVLLTQLTSLDVGGNNFADGHLPPQIGQLTSLTSLKLTQTSITGLDSILSLGKLVKLILPACEVETLPPSLGSSLSRLTELVVSQNGLKSLEGLEGASQLLYLRAFMNAIPAIPVSCLKTWSSLVELSLASNQVSVLPDEIGELRSLELLDLSFNKLSALPESINQCTALRRILLPKNRFEEFPNIAGLVNLTEIDLAGNRIKRLPEDFFFPELVEFNVCKNQIADLPVAVLRLVEFKLKKLHIQYNQLPRLPLISKPELLTSLQVFNFKFNQFIELPDEYKSIDSYMVDAIRETIPDKVTDLIYIGSFISAKNVFALKSFGITHILNAAYYEPRIHYPEQFTYKILNLHDSHTQDMLEVFPVAMRWIEDATASGKVFIHCQAGVSRSATLVIAWLLYKHKWPLIRALHHLSNTRPKIDPNNNFIRQLVQYEQQLFGSTSLPLEAVTTKIKSESSEIVRIDWKSLDPNSAVLVRAIIDDSGSNPGNPKEKCD